MRIALFITLSGCFVASSALANLGESVAFVRSSVQNFGLKTMNPAMDTEYVAFSEQENERSLEFETNVSGAYRFSIGTKYLDIGLTSPLSGDEEVENTDYNDLYLKSRAGGFELTYHNAKYTGAYANVSSPSKEDSFYEEYSIRKSSIRVSYFWNVDLNRALSEPKEATRLRAVKNQNYLASWISTVGYDNNKTRFPTLSNNETVKFFGQEAAVIDPIKDLSTKTTYLGIGYGGVHMLTENFSYHFRLTVGFGKQDARWSRTSSRGELRGGGGSRYTDFDFGLGYMVKGAHHIGIGVESYTHFTTIKDTGIGTQARQASLFYQYFL